MLNYIKSECFKTLHRNYTYIILGCLVVFAILLNIFFYLGFHSFHTSAAASLQEVSNLSLSFGISLFNLLPYFILIIVDIVFSEEYKYKTFKNTLSWGVTRTQVYLGKYLVSLLTLLSFYAITLATYFLSHFIIFGLPTNWVPLLVLLNRFLAALPLLVGAMGLCIALSFIIPNNTAFEFTYMGLTIVPYQLFYLLCWINPFWSPFFWGSIATPFNRFFVSEASTLNQNFLNSVSFFMDIKTTSFSTMLPLGTLVYCLLLGLCYFIISTFIGLTVFKNREIR